MSSSPGGRGRRPGRDRERPGGEAADDGDRPAGELALDQLGGGRTSSATAVTVM
jgi:hypothetical protein